MRNLAWIVAVCLLSLSQSVISDGVSFRVKILSVVLGANNSAVITIKPEEPLDPKAAWVGCETVTVFVKLEKKPWWGDLVTEEKHREALSLLAGAARARTIIRFGAMGGGFRVIPRRTCELESHGLALVDKQVLSFHGAL